MAPVRTLLLGLASVACLTLPACGDPDPVAPDAPVVIDPTANPDRDIVDTQLAFDVTALTGTATITFAPSTTPGATLEVGDLVIDQVTLDGAPLAHAPGIAVRTIDLALAPSDAPIAVTIGFHYQHHTGFKGATTSFTFLWPYYCGNLFPCHSQPRDGLTLGLELTGVPAGMTAVYPTTIPEAPSYQLAWAIDAYAEVALGTTTAGTQVSVWHRPGELATAQAGTTNLVAVFDWLERTIGPYRFGSKVGTVSVKWGPGAYGGMEHHPLWHVSADSLASEETNAHEAAHGWFGDGIRIACWEDFVLSEGTVTYLAGRALDVVAPAVGAQVWTDYASDLAGIDGRKPVWPQSCNSVDILEDDLFTNAPYIRGAFFYRGVALKVGADVLDRALAAFYAAHAGKGAHMSDMLATIQAETGYDATACAATWLGSTTRPTPGPCP